MAGPLHTGPASAKTLEGAFDEAENSGVLDLSCRKLKEYPNIAAEHDLKDTVDANLSKNKLSDLPSEVCMYTSLEVLNCHHNCIRAIPPEVSLLHRLTHLDLSRNQLSTLPPQLCQLLSLEILLVASNRLVSLPEEVGQLSHLVQLDASWNEISQLPIQICDLGSLRCLNVRKNLLVELPAELCKLNLRSLDLSSNKVQRIPLECRHMKSLEDLQLDNNPLICPPAHVCTKGRVHIMKYLQIEAVREDKKRGVMGDNNCIFRRELSRGSFQKDVDVEVASLGKRGSSASSSTVFSNSAANDLRRPVGTDETLAIEVDAAMAALKAAESMREQRQERRLELQRRTSGRDVAAAAAAAAASSTASSPAGQAPLGASARSSPTSMTTISPAGRLPPRPQPQSAPAAAAAMRTGSSSVPQPPTLLYQESNGSVPASGISPPGSSRPAPVSPIQQSPHDDMFSKAKSLQELQKRKNEYEQKKKRAEQIKQEEMERKRHGSPAGVSDDSWAKAAPTATIGRQIGLHASGNSMGIRGASGSGDRLPRPTAGVLASRSSASSPSAGSPGSSASSSPSSLSPSPMNVPEGVARNGSWPFNGQPQLMPPALPPRLQGGAIDSADGSRSGLSRRDDDHVVSASAAPVSPVILSQEDAQLLLSLRKNIEARLKIPLAEDIATALRDGVILCHLANNIKPRSVSQIHVPSPAVPKLTVAKCRKNVDSFIDACRRLGVPQDKMCSTADVLEDKRPLPVARTVQALCDLSIARRAVTAPASAGSGGASPSTVSSQGLGTPSARRHPLSSAV